MTTCIKGIIETLRGCTFMCAIEHNCDISTKKIERAIQEDNYI